MNRPSAPTAMRLALSLLLLLVLGTGASRALGQQDRFDHDQHRKLFPTCATCHAGVLDSTRAVFPTVASCESCHDGEVEKKVDWQPQAVSRPSNLRFSHGDHRSWAAREIGPDSAIGCSECHTPADSGWMNVRRTITGRCLDCHGIKVAHLSAPDTACATCHLTLAEAKALPRERVAAFEAPPSHEAAGFLGRRGHGKLAAAPAGGDLGVSPSCATCHARDFCAQCHVNAPEVRVIQALAPDARSLAHEAKMEEPPSHERADFLTRHGPAAQKTSANCTTCHTNESCLACHRAAPAVAVALPAAGPGRAEGARITRRRPATHTADFADRHGAVAGAAPASCSTCHTRTECLDCHRPAAGTEGTYHPAGFLTRHPSAAYNRQTDCAECHNPQQFCSTCHVQAGLRSRGAIDAGYHDAKGAFLLNHGTAARQTIESCATCHTERDCLQCHSATSGRRFNPHGPGFNPERLAERNPQSCSACHGRTIPRRE